MTDRVYPSAKPNGPAAAATTAPQPAAKPNLYNPTRPHPYRPQPNRHHHRRRRSRRSCVCLCCFWSLLLLAIFLLLSAIAGCAVYVLYSPRRPTFSVTTLRISRFNLSTNAAADTTHLTAALNLTISAKNPNKKIIYTYDPISITALSDQVLIANGSFPFFTSDPQNTTIIRSSLSISSELVDVDLVKTLRLDLKRKNGFGLEILMDTKVVVKMEKLKSKKLGIRVTCNGIHGIVPKGKSPSIASITDAKCKVDLRIKIWKWIF